MKQFEKWAGPAFYYGKNPLDRPVLDAKRKAWKAALEWVLEMFNTNTLNPPPTLNVREEIRAELKND